MIPQKSPKFLAQFLNKILLGLVLISSLNQSASAQIACDHLTLDYNVNQWYYALGIYNTSLEESEWTIEISNAHYQLDGKKFKKPKGIKLTVETTANADGTYNHLISPDRSIGAYQYLNFVYKGVPSSTNNNYEAASKINCSFNYVPLCANLDFNFFNEGQYYLGFSVQNNNSIAYYPYEIYIDDATYNIDVSQLNYGGFDFFETDNGNGTYDYYFLAQAPIEG